MMPKQMEVKNLRMAVNFRIRRLSREQTKRQTFAAPGRVRAYAMMTNITCHRHEECGRTGYAFFARLNHNLIA